MTSRPAYSDIARRRRFAATALHLRARAVRWELELEDSLALQPEPAPAPATDLPLDDLEWSDADEPPTALPPGSDDESLEDGALGPEPGPTAIRSRPSDHRVPDTERDMHLAACQRYSETPLVTPCPACACADLSSA